MKESGSNQLDQNTDDKRNAHQDNQHGSDVLEHHQPVRSIQVRMTPREAKSNMSIKMKFDHVKSGFQILG